VESHVFEANAASCDTHFRRPAQQMVERLAVRNNVAGLEGALPGFLRKVSECRMEVYVVAYNGFMHQFVEMTEAQSGTSRGLTSISRISIGPAGTAPGSL
jgi:hypothetical protein